MPKAGTLVRIEARVGVFAVAGKAAFCTGPVSSPIARKQDKHLICIDFILRPRSQ
jgi:hypothetical protein